MTREKIDGIRTSHFTSCSFEIEKGGTIRLVQTRLDTLSFLHAVLDHGGPRSISFAVSRPEREKVQGWPGCLQGSQTNDHTNRNCDNGHNMGKA